MKIISDVSVPLNINNPVITVGTFDGLHVGHRQILSRVLELAKSRAKDSAVITFYPHPRIVLGQDVALLNSQEEKRQIIKSTGIANLIEIPFTLEFSDLSADDFISFINNMIKPSVVVIGYDHGFGRNRSGDIDTLRKAGELYGFEVVYMEPVFVEEHKVSSTIIRNLLLDGEVEIASRLLGSPYSLMGKVIRGNQIGKRIGFPTANLLLDDQYKLIPAMGVYASLVEYKGEIYKGMTNIGLRPTINAHQLTVETNIFSFEEDIYYESLTIKLIERIRDERKFGNLNSLKEQLKADRETTIKLLKGY